MLRALFVTALLSLSSCISVSALKEPRVEVKAVEISQLDFSGGKIEVTCDVDNPNNKDLNISSVDYHLLLNGKSFLKDRIDKEFQLKANAKTQVKIPLRFTTQNIANGFEAFSLGQALKYEVIGRAKVGVFSVPFAQKGEWKPF